MFFFKPFRSETYPAFKNKLKKVDLVFRGVFEVLKKVISKLGIEDEIPKIKAIEQRPIDTEVQKIKNSIHIENQKIECELMEVKEENTKITELLNSITQAFPQIKYAIDKSKIKPNTDLLDGILRKHITIT